MKLSDSLVFILLLGVVGLMFYIAGQGETPDRTDQSCHCDPEYP